MESSKFVCRTARFDGYPPLKPPFSQRGGAVAALVGVSRDITEQKQAELALQQSEEKYRQIVETAAEGVWIFNERFGRCSSTPKWLAMLGCVPEEMAQRPVSDFLLDEDNPSQLERFEKSNSSMSTADVRLRRKDGSAIWTILASSPHAGFIGTPHRHARHVHRCDRA